MIDCTCNGISCSTCADKRKLYRHHTTLKRTFHVKLISFRASLSVKFPQIVILSNQILPQPGRLFSAVQKAGLHLFSDVITLASAQHQPQAQRADTSSKLDNLNGNNQLKIMRTLNTSIKWQLYILPRIQAAVMGQSSGTYVSVRNAASTFAGKNSSLGEKRCLFCRKVFQWFVSCSWREIIVLDCL